MEELPIPASPEDVPKSPKGKEDVARAHRLRALSLRMAGLTYAEIARQMDVEERTAARWVDDAFEEATPDRESISRSRELENIRLNRLQAAWWPLAIQGDQQAFDNVLKIHDRRVRMNGLAAPSQVNLNVGIRAEMEAALEELERLVVDAEVIEEDHGDDTAGSVGESPYSGAVSSDSGGGPEDYGADQCADAEVPRATR